MGEDDYADGKEIQDTIRNMKMSKRPWKGWICQKQLSPQVLHAVYNQHIHVKQINLEVRKVFFQYI
jgi:hypothetical protein